MEEGQEGFEVGVEEEERREAVVHQERKSCDWREETRWGPPFAFSRPEEVG